MPAEPTVPISPLAPISPDGPTVPVVPSAAPAQQPAAQQPGATVPVPPAGGGDQTDPTLKLPPGGNAQARPDRTRPPAETRVEPKPEKWAGRVVVPGAAGPGQKKQAAPTTPTQKMTRYAEPHPTVVGPRDAPRAVLRPQAPPGRAPGRRRRSGLRRFLGAVVALLLLLAVPVVSAYVAYKLASGDSPFVWPPTVDLSRVF